MAVSSVIGFAPAILLLYILLRRYEGLFEDRMIFFFFTGGIVAGMIITAFHLVSDDFILEHLDLSLLVFVLLFAMFEESAKLVILNLPRFHLKHETAYYGAALGIGIGSMAIVAISFRQFTVNPGSFGDPLAMFGFIVLSFNFCLLQGATGAMIGFGCAKGEVLRFFLRAVMYHSAYNLFILLFMWRVPGVMYVSLFLASLFAFWLYWYVLRYVMPRAAPPEMLKKRRRDIRKRVREEKGK